MTASLQFVNNHLFTVLNGFIAARQQAFKMASVVFNCPVKRLKSGVTWTLLCSLSPIGSATLALSVGLKQY